MAPAKLRGGLDISDGRGDVKEEEEADQTAQNISGVLGTEETERPQMMNKSKPSSNTHLYLSLTS